MFRIVGKEVLSENVTKLIIEAGIIARKRKPGQFIIVRTGEGGERIPLTIADADPSQNAITVVIQRVGTTSHKLAKMEPGDWIDDVVGPLGQPTKIEDVGTVIAAGGGVGIAPLYPIAKAFREAGNRLITILAARSKELLIFEKEMEAFSDELVIMTDDGSRGKQGLITVGMEEIIRREQGKINLVITIGPAIMMKFVALLTKKFNIRTMASLNTIMVDGTGMCGACRITVGGRTKFVCVDGPEFDAHEVDFDEMLKRLNAYKNEEKLSYSRYLQREP